MMSSEQQEEGEEEQEEREEAEKGRGGAGPGIKHVDLPAKALNNVQYTIDSEQLIVNSGKRSVNSEQWTLYSA